MRIHPRIGLALIAGALALSAIHAYADCVVPDDDSPGDCQVWPANPELTIRATTAFIADKQADPSGKSGSYDLALQLENSATHVPIATYKPAALYATALRELTIDTGRYVLSPTTRTFGLHTRFAHASSTNPYAAEHLALYVQQGSALRPVLENLVVYDQQGAWDAATCTGEGVEHHRTIEIGKGVSHGFADLVLHTETIPMKAVGQGGECDVDNGEPQMQLTTLHYNGSEYPVPAAMRSL